MEKKRFVIFIENHIGFGIRWGRFNYQLDISIAILFVTVQIGIGREL